jgi:hypothetical protein
MIGLIMRFWKPITLGVVGLVGFIFVNRFFKSKKTNAIVSAAAEKVDNSELSYSETEFKAFAERMRVALIEDADEDEDEVMNVAKKMQNSSDWNYLCVKFGVQEDNSYFKSFEGDLEQAIREYITGSDFDDLEAQLNLIGVTLE